MKRKILIGSLILIFGCASFANAGDDYPYKNENPEKVDPWGFYYRNCTSFVAWRMNKAGVSFSNHMNGGHWGNAEHWDENAKFLGYRVDTTPHVGAIAQWDAYGEAEQRWGHVAYVAAVNGDGSVLIEEYNWGKPYCYSSRDNIRAPRYIHILPEDNDLSGEVYDGHGGPLTSGNSYIVVDNVTVPSNQTLTIQPDVTIYFDSGKKMTANGTLAANGESDKPIYLISNDENRQGIKLNSNFRLQGGGAFMP